MSRTVPTKNSLDNTFDNIKIKIQAELGWIMGGLDSGVDYLEMRKRISNSRGRILAMIDEIRDKSK